MQAYKFLSVGLVLLSASVNAESGGAISIIGAIADQACVIDSESSDQIVSMGNISTSAFRSAGQVASPTRFSLIMRDCPETMNYVSVKFSGVSDLANPSLLSLDETSTARGVGIAIYESDSDTLLPLYSESNRRLVENHSESIQMSFIAKYMATAAAVSPGTANSRTDFVVLYN